MGQNRADWSGIWGDAALLFILFAVWVWQFESSAAGSIYHTIVAAIGFVAAVGLGLIALLVLIEMLRSGGQDHP